MPPSILQVPVVSNVIIIAWATGADIYLDELDEAFLISLGRLKKEMRKYYPHFPCTTKIYTKKIIKNTFSNDGIGLLFSGGVDSTASYLRNRTRKPNLIMVWGVDIPREEDKFWMRVKKIARSMARKEGVEINFIKTNLHEFIDELILNICFHRYIGTSWWLGVQFAVSTAGLSAPLTVVKSIGTLLMASGITSDYKEIENVDFYQSPGWCSNYLHGNYGWANVVTLYDGMELTRHEKIRRLLKKELTKENHNLMIRVCFSERSSGLWGANKESFNCGNCEKCWRTIIGFVLEGIDPNKCGFMINNHFFPMLKTQLLYNSNLFIKSEYDLFLWEDIQKHIPQEMNRNNAKYLYNSENFFAWFRNVNLSKLKMKPHKIPNILSYLGYFYSHFPKKIHIILFRIQKIWMRIFPIHATILKSRLR